MELERLTEEYLRHLEHIQQLQKIADNLKKSLVESIEHQGEEDEKGHQWLPAGKYLLQRQRRQGQSKLNIQRAEEWARERGIWDKVSKSVEVLDEDSLMGYLYDHREDEDIEEQVQSLYDPAPVSYAFVKPVEEASYDY
jgi:hypothetical protein